MIVVANTQAMADQVKVEVEKDLYTPFIDRAERTGCRMTYARAFESSMVILCLMY